MSFANLKKQSSLGSLTQKLVKEVEKRGYKTSSIGSLLTQFVKNGLCVRDANGNYTAIAHEYTPIKVRKQVKAKQVIAKAKATRGEGIAALGAQPTQRVAPIVTAWDADTIINNIQRTITSYNKRNDI